MRQDTKDRVPGSGGRSSAPAPRRRRGGFTLIEMLVVVFIMALLMGLLVRNMRNSDERAKRAATENTIEKVKAAIEEFYAEYGQYPPVPVYPGDNCQPIYFEFPAKYTSPPLKSGHPLLKMSGTDVLVPEFIDKTHPDSKERLDRKSVV
jgi:prepilin-type N-terminal cleavage/methylation domain-containing protein